MSRSQVFATAMAALLLAACGQEAPTAPTVGPTLVSQLVPVPPGPNPQAEEIVVCKQGGQGDIPFTYSGLYHGAPISGSFTIQPGQCWHVGYFGGSGANLTITEIVPPGQEVVSIAVDQLNRPDRLLTGTNSVSDVIGMGQPTPDAAVVTFTNRVLPPPPPPGTQGCTPGYWKNHTDSWAGTGYTPSQTAGSVFALGGFPSLASKTLLATLNGGGGSGATGGAIILLRAGVAGLLNAAHSGVNYTMTQAQIIAAVNAALASGERSKMIDLGGKIDDDNNLGCPLN